MSNLMVRATLPAITSEMLVKVRALESDIAQQPQTQIPTEHILHGGMYARTVRVPAGTKFTGSLIKRATMLIINGYVGVTTNDDVVWLDGYHVIPASAGRKQAFATLADTELTMIFPTNAQTVEEAESEVFAECDLLLSRRQENETITITGE